MQHRVLIALAVFTAIAAYQVGYYQSRLSVSAEVQMHNDADKTVYAKTARTPQVLPLVTPRLKQNSQQASHDKTMPAGPSVTISGE